MITGGGTGGHVFPALAIAQELIKRGLEVLYVGTQQGMEAKLVPPTSIPFFTVKAGAIKNQSFGKIIRTLFRLAAGVTWAIRFLWSQKPAAVIGVGGYVSVPICFSAFLLRIPVYLQEQNSSVGLANRWLGRLAKKVFLGFEDAQQYFSPKKCVVTGNPVRPEFTNGSFPRFQPEGCCLLIMGGSQGARAINLAIEEHLEALARTFPGLRIIHQTGKTDFERIRTAYEKRYSGKFEVNAFIENIAQAYGEASLVVSRSGALTCSELIAVGRPAILVPYPRRGQNDQITNAYLLQNNGCARVVEQGEDFAHRLWLTLTEIFHPSQLFEMNKHFHRLRKSGALVTIGDHIEKDLGRVPTSA